MENITGGWEGGGCWIRTHEPCSQIVQVRQIVQTMCRALNNALKADGVRNIAR